MSSDRKNESNRLNAQSSTGPQSQPGKDISKMNALKYGLSGEFVLLAWEVPEEFEEMKAFYLHEMKPHGIQEYEVAVRLVQHAWRINRSLLSEQEIQERSICADDRDRRLSNLYLAQGRLRRQEEKDRKEMSRLRQERMQGTLDPVENERFLQPRPATTEDHESPYLPLDVEEGRRWQDHCYDVALANMSAQRHLDAYQQAHAQAVASPKKSPAEKKRALIEKLKPKANKPAAPENLGSFSQNEATESTDPPISGSSDTPWEDSASN